MGGFHVAERRRTGGEAAHKGRGAHVEAHGRALDANRREESVLRQACRHLERLAERRPILEVGDSLRRSVDETPDGVAASVGLAVVGELAAVRLLARASEAEAKRVGAERQLRAQSRPADPAETLRELSDLKVVSACADAEAAATASPGSARATRALQPIHADV
jgi:hypothetical protein